MRIFLALVLGTFMLMSCSGWKRTSESGIDSSFETNNVSVDTGPVKVKSGNKSSKVSLFGKKVEVTNEKGKKQAPEGNPKQFLNGDICKYCEYISRTENEQGNLVEAEVSGGYRNGEEREYHDGIIIRSSYFVDGGKSGMEYTYSNGKVTDSVYIETTSGYQWHSAKIKKALPGPIANYIYNLHFKNSSAEFALTTYDGKISTIYKKDESDTSSSGLPIVAKIEYEPGSFLTNYKVIIRKPFFEDMLFKEHELVQRKKVQGTQTTYDFVKGSFLKEFYNKGALKKEITGDIAASVDESEECFGMCHAQVFFENGMKKEENFFMDGKLKERIQWNDKNVVVYEYKFPRYLKEYYDDGSLKKEINGELTRDSLHICKNCFIKSFYPNGIHQSEEVFEKGEPVRSTHWWESGKLKIETEISKYQKTYYENGQLESEDLGDIKMNNDTMTMYNGTSKKWNPDGVLVDEISFKDNKITSLKSWDSTGMQTIDFEENKHLKTCKNSSPELRMDWTGNIVYGNEKYNCIGTCTLKRYLGKTLIYHEITDGYDSTTGKFQKATTVRYDSTGKKERERLYQFGELVSEKYWDIQNNFLKHDFNANSYLKIYYGPKNIQSEFKGKSSMDNNAQTKYIDGTLTRYHKNGKKSSVSIWKNGEPESRKDWDENGALLTEFQAGKELLLYSPDTKKLRFHFKGNAEHYFDKNQYAPIDGVGQFFDESGKATKTITYKEGAVVETVQE